MGLVSLEVWSAPRCHLGGPLHPTRSWWRPLGIAQLLVRVSGHPAWTGSGRSILSVSSRSLSVSLTTMPCGRQGKEQARRATGSACGGTLSAVCQGLPPRSFSRPMAQNSSVLCGDGGEARASHMQSTHPLRALGAPRAQHAQLLAQLLLLCLLLLVEWSHNWRADAPAGRADSSG